MKEIKSPSRVAEAQKVGVSMNVSDNSLSDLEHARELISMGVPVFVAKPKGDGDFWLPKKWQETRPDEAVLNDYKPGDALGAVMGTAFDVLDIDPRHGGDASFEQLAAELGDDFPEIYGEVSTPSGGQHYWIAPLGVGKHDPIHKENYPGLDLQGGKPDGSSRGFVFIPPTVRPSKAPDNKGELRPYVYEQFPSKPEDDTSGEKLAALVITPKPSPAQNTQPVIGVGWREEVNASWYHKSLDELIAEVESAGEGTRNDTLNTVAFVAFSNNRIDNDEAIERLREAALSTGLPESEVDTLLEHTRNDAEKQHEASQRVSERSTATTKTLAVRETEQLPDTSSLMGNYLNVKTLAQLDRTPLSYRVDGILPMKSNVLFSAYRKSGKTTTMLSMVNAMTSSADFIGRHCTTVSGSVVYVNFELPEDMFSNYSLDCGLQLERKNVHVAQLRGKASRFQINNDAFALMFADYLKEIDCEVLVVDPLSVIVSALGGDEWNNPFNRQILERFSEVAEIAEVNNLIVVDHSGHDNQGRSRGASSKEDWADVLWTQEKKADGTRTLKVEGRGVEDEKILFTRDPETKELVAKIPPDIDDGDKNVVLSAVKAQPGIDTNELCKAANMTRQTINSRAGTLENSGKIRIERKSGKPNRYYPVENDDESGV